MRPTSAIPTDPPPRLLACEPPSPRFVNRELVFMSGCRFRFIGAVALEWVRLRNVERGLIIDATYSSTGRMKE